MKIGTPFTDNFPLPSPVDRPRLEQQAAIDQVDTVLTQMAVEVIHYHQPRAVDGWHAGPRTPAMIAGRNWHITIPESGSIFFCATAENKPMECTAAEAGAMASMTEDKYRPNISHILATVPGNIRRAQDAAWEAMARLIGHLASLKIAPVAVEYAHMTNADNGPMAAAYGPTAEQTGRAGGSWQIIYDHDAGKRPHFRVEGWPHGTNRRRIDAETVDPARAADIAYMIEHDQEPPDYPRWSPEDYPALAYFTGAYLASMIESGCPLRPFIWEIPDAEEAPPLDCRIQLPTGAIYTGTTPLALAVSPDALTMFGFYKDQYLAVLSAPGEAATAWQDLNMIAAYGDPNEHMAEFTGGPVEGWADISRISITPGHLLAIVLEERLNPVDGWHGVYNTLKIDHPTPDLARALAHAAREANLIAPIHPAGPGEFEDPHDHNPIRTDPNYPMQEVA